MRISKAFTLIELLVVIAIIAAILFPVFAQAKLAAKETVSLSNSKQIALANFMYMGDNDDHLIKEFFGFPADCQSWGSVYYNWRHALNPYLAKSNGLLADPTNSFKDPQYWTNSYTDGNTADDEYLPANYAVNNHVIGFANGQCAGPWTPTGMDTLDQLDSVADTIIIIPNRSQWNDLKIDFMSSTDETTPGWCITPRSGGNPVCPPTGDGAINSVTKQAAFVWADGHAKRKAVAATLRLSDLIHDDWASSYAINPVTGTNWTHADRVQISQTLYPEYQ